MVRIHERFARLQHYTAYDKCHSTAQHSRRWNGFCRLALALSARYSSDIASQQPLPNATNDAAGGHLLALVLLWHLSYFPQYGRKTGTGAVDVCPLGPVGEFG